MRKLLLSLTFGLAFYSSRSQNFDVSRHPNGDKMLTVTLSNLIRIHEITFTNFLNLMQTYQYKLTSEGYYRFEGGEAGSQWNCVFKDQGKSGIMWTYPDDMTIMKLKDELKPYYYESEDGKTYYHLSNNGIKYVITIGNHWAGISNY